MKTLPFILMMVLLASCSSSMGENVLLDAYQESCQLTDHDLDSVNRFDDRFHCVYPISQYGREELYGQIEGNVEKAKAYFTEGLSLSIDTIWADSTIIQF